MKAPMRQNVTSLTLLILRHSADIACRQSRKAKEFLRKPLTQLTHASHIHRGSRLYISLHFVPECAHIVMHTRNSLSPIFPKWNIETSAHTSSRAHTQGHMGKFTL
jgi:hypothetical protein